MECSCRKWRSLSILGSCSGAREGWCGRLTDALIMRSMYQSVVMKKELSCKAKLWIYQSIYVPTLTYGHELWVMTERTRSRILAAKIRFLRRVAGRSLRDRVRSHSGGAQSRAADPRHREEPAEVVPGIWCILDAFLGRCSGCVPPGGDPGEDPGHSGGWIMSPDWPGNASVSPRRSRRKCLGRGKSGHLCLDCWPGSG